VTREGGAELFGRSRTDRELPRRVGRLDQVADIEPLVLDDGPARGVQSLRVQPGSGLSLTGLPGRGMDLAAAEHRGVSLAWLSPPASSRPPSESRRARAGFASFHGGLLVTCGLQNVGPPGEKGGEALGLHGRISNIPEPATCRVGGTRRKSVRGALYGWLPASCSDTRSRRGLCATLERRVSGAVLW
jgi:Domain of unknown function (DUF4432)